MKWSERAKERIWWWSAIVLIGSMAYWLLEKGLWELMRNAWLR